MQRALLQTVDLEPECGISIFRKAEFDRDHQRQLQGGECRHAPQQFRPRTRQAAALSVAPSATANRPRAGTAAQASSFSSAVWPDLGRLSTRQHSGGSAGGSAATTGAFLMGRASYEYFAPAWSKGTGPYMDRLNEIRKIVFSASLTSVDEWRNTEIVATDASGMPAWRKRLFLATAHIAADAVDYFKLPRHRTVLLGSAIEI